MATHSADLALVDTNVLVYALYDEAEHHAASAALLDRVQAGELALAITPQALAEVYAVITDSRRVTAPYDPAEALKAIEGFLAMPNTTLLPAPVDLVSRWMGLVRQHPVTRGRIFDLQLIATMLGNGVTRIYTFDRSHFEPFEEIDAVLP